MALTLATARTIVENAIHVGTTTFSDTKIEEAIEAAINRFNRETNAVLSYNTETVADNEGDHTFTTTDFHSSQVVAIFNNATGDEIDIVPLRTALRRAAGSGSASAGDDPEMMGWMTHNRGFFYPLSDGTTSIRVVMRNPASGIIGGADSLDLVSICPIEWLVEILKTGAKFYLLDGMPGHPESERAYQGFMDVIAQAKASGQLPFADRVGGQDQQLIKSRGAN